MKNQLPVHDPAAEGQLARALFSQAFMSDSKWRKLFEIVRNKVQGIDGMLVKFIDVVEPRYMKLPSLRCPHAYMDSTEFGPVALRSIEWVEFDGDLNDQLIRHGLFMTETHDHRTRVIGYRK
jgi:hypothetical protein